MEAFGRFLDILDELRVKCPWDKKQTNESLRPNTIEETYELCDALMRDDKQDICKELGDVLLHVAFYAKIGSETGDFDMKDVCDRLCEKLIFRHPHVFGDVKAETAGQVSENWEQLKLREKGGNKTVLSGVPSALPSLIKAYRIQDKARNVGFDWEEREQVWDKVKEEIQEFQAEVAHMDKQKAEEEASGRTALEKIILIYRFYIDCILETGLEFVTGLYSAMTNPVFNFLERDADEEVVLDRCRQYLEEGIEAGEVKADTNMNEALMRIAIIITGNIYYWCVFDGRVDLAYQADSMLQNYLCTLSTDPNCTFEVPTIPHDTNALI